MHIEEHGGGCCGASHLVSFYTSNDSKIMAGYVQQMNNLIEQRIQDLRDRLSEEDEDEDGEFIPYEGDIHHLFEVILAPYQKVVWHNILIERGFVEGVSWVNSNTDNLLTMYTLAT